MKNGQIFEWKSDQAQGNQKQLTNRLFIAPLLTHTRQIEENGEIYLATVDLSTPNMPSWRERHCRHELEDEERRSHRFFVPKFPDSHGAQKNDCDKKTPSNLFAVEQAFFVCRFDTMGKRNDIMQKVSVLLLDGIDREQDMR